MEGWFWLEKKGKLVGEICLKLRYVVDSDVKRYGIGYFFDKQYEPITSPRLLGDSEDVCISLYLSLSLSMRCDDQ